MTFRLLILIFSIPLLISQCNRIGPDELVEIPDSAFLKALISEGVDENGDGQISYDEAETVISLDIPSSNISDITGIEAFVNLDSLVLRMNPISTPDVSKNSMLKYLDVSGCELTSIDISKNVELEYLNCAGDMALDNYLSVLDVSNIIKLESLDCSGNEITALDISNNISLKTLICGRNMIQSLDVYSNTELTRLICNNNLLTELDISGNWLLTAMISCGNQLTSLDISNNPELLKIGFDNMPSLFEVCVWTTPFPPPGVVILADYSPNVYFTTECGR